MPFDEHIRLQALMSSITRQTEDAAEGAKAFAEKRKPQFKGR
jgi:enoyl-CoA hydratase/carnithine racemase